MKQDTGHEWLIAAAILISVAVGFAMRWVWGKIKRLFSRRASRRDYVVAVLLFVVFTLFIIILTNYNT